MDFIQSYVQFSAQISKNTEMDEKPIMICNYSFVVSWRTPKGKKLNQITIHEKLSPLIGHDADDIRLDPTGYNKNIMRRIYNRTDGTHSNISISTFTITDLEILRQNGKTTHLKNQ
jgi:hypothetical protein